MKPIGITTTFSRMSMTALLAAVLWPSWGFGACQFDFTRDTSASLSLEEAAARSVFLSDLCRARRDQLYDVDDSRLTHRLTRPSFTPINYAEIYPAYSKREHHEGQVFTAFVVDANGNVSNVSVISSSGYNDLDDAATIFLAGKHFDDPARLDGVNVAVVMYQRFRFKLRRLT